MATPRTPITRDDIERQLRALQGEVADEVDGQRNTLLAGAAAAGVLLLIIAFLLGRRNGRKKTTFVEIRRL